MKRSLTRDGAITAFAITMGVFEIVVGGGRPIVLTFLGAIFASIVPLHLDQARQKRKQDEESE